MFLKQCQEKKISRFTSELFKKVAVFPCPILTTHLMKDCHLEQFLRKKTESLVIIVLSFTQQTNKSLF